MISVRGAALLLLSLTVATPAFAATSLERCRELEAEFDYQGVLAECTLAVGEDITEAEKMEAYKLLGFANTALGKARAGRAWFIRLLTLTPAFVPGPEVSPRFRKNFDLAKKEFDLDAKVTLSHTPPEVAKSFSSDAPPIALSFVAADKLGLVAKAVVVASATWDGLEAPKVAETEATLERAGGETTISAALPDPARAESTVPAAYELAYSLKLFTGGGEPVDVEDEVAVTLSMTGPAPALPLDMTWLIIGGGAALAVTTVVASVALVCGSGVCSPRFQTAPVAGVSVAVAQ